MEIIDRYQQDYYVQYNHPNDETTLQEGKAHAAYGLYPKQKPVFTVNDLPMLLSDLQCLGYSQRTLKGCQYK